MKLLYSSCAVAVIGLGLAFFRAHRPAQPSPVSTTSVAPLAKPTPVLAPDELLRDALELRDGRLHRIDTGERFTGTLVERYSSTAIRARIQIRDGLAHGLSLGWYDTGEPEVHESFVNGRSHGVRTRWYKNGNRRSEAEIQDGRLQGVYREWHENGQLAVEMTLVADRPVGVVRRWNPDGQSRPDYVPGPVVASAR